MLLRPAPLAPIVIPLIYLPSSRAPRPMAIPIPITLHISTPIPPPRARISFHIEICVSQPAIPNSLRFSPPILVGVIIHPPPLCPPTLIKLLLLRPLFLYLPLLRPRQLPQPRPRIELLLPLKRRIMRVRLAQDILQEPCIRLGSSRGGPEANGN
jgi:hypothetical protein